MSLKDECSLKDCTKLRELIVNNPDLPLLLFVGEYVWTGDHQYSQAYCKNPTIEEVTLYDETWMSRSDYEESLDSDLAIEEEYKNLSDEEYSDMIKKKVDNTEFVKAIVAYMR